MEPNTLSSLSILDTYEYDPLPNSESIRVLILHPGCQDDPLLCTLLTCPDYQNGVQYDALSYVWGDVRDTTNITVNEKPLPITQNLAAALHRLRLPTRSRTVWADAVCIDQRNLVERGQQVSLMKHIFAFASEVFVWLGPADESTESALALLRGIALRCVRKAYTSDDAAHNSSDDASENASDDVSSWVNSLRREENFVRLVSEVESGDLPPRGSVAYRPVFDLIARPWFSRVWVIQEVRGCRNITMVIGPHEIEWDVVSLAATWISSGRSGVDDVWAFVPDDASGLRAASFMRDMRVETALEVPFFHVLWLAQKFKSTDPRDKVFSLLDFEVRRRKVDDWGRSFCETFPNELDNYLQTHLDLKADYSMSILQVFREVTVRSIQQHGCLEALSYAHGLLLDNEYPSWIAPWHRPYYSAVLPLETFIYDAGSGTKASRLACFDQDILKLDGIEWDSVAGTVSYLVLGDAYESPIPSTSETGSDQMGVADSHCIQGLGDDKLVSLSCLLVADSSDVQDTRASSDLGAHLAHFSAYLLPILERYKRDAFLCFQIVMCDICRQKIDTDQISVATPFSVLTCPTCSNGDYTICTSCFGAGKRCPEKEHRMEDIPLPCVLVRYSENLIARLGEMDDAGEEAFEHVAQTSGSGRLFFRTEKGYLGLGPRFMQAGDVVAVLFGGRVPFILRPTDGYFRLVGECYIHGIMDGEVVQMWRDSKLASREFNLR